MDRDRFSGHYCRGRVVAPQQRELMIKLKLEARGQFGLYERLIRMRGICLSGAYTIRYLMDVGGQGILFVAEDNAHPGTDVVIKMPYLPYHRQAYFDLAMIEQARCSIRWEAYILSRFAGTILPELYDFWDGENPLYDPAWSDEIRKREFYLAMELIRGLSLEEVIAQLHAGDIQPRSLEQLAWNVMYQVLDLCETLWQDGRFLYTDLRPQNILLVGSNAPRNFSSWRRRFRLPEEALPQCKTDTLIRVIDGGSVVKWGSEKQEFPYHPAYAPPHFNTKGQKDSTKAPDPSFVIYTLGKTLFQVLTNQEPLPGCNPTFEEPILENYSPSLLHLLEAMLFLEDTSFSDLKKEVILYAKPYLWKGTTHGQVC